VSARPVFYERSQPDKRARGTETSKATFDVSWNNEVRGCKYRRAANFDPRATIDDGSCIFPVLGCTYAAAENYNPDANGRRAFDTAAPLPRRRRRHRRAAEPPTLDLGRRLLFGAAKKISRSLSMR